jgi:hypothetical protein
VPRLGASSQARPDYGLGCRHDHLPDLPACHSKAITEEVMEAHADVIFDQAENRLHAQKAVIVEIVRRQAY